MKTHVTVATFETRQDAEKVLEFLRHKGLEAELADETSTESVFMQVEPRAALKVQVAQEMVTGAEDLLRTWGAQEHGALICPECGKSRIEYPQFTRQYPGPMLAYALLCKLGLLEPQFYCRDCHHTWAPTPQKPKPPEDPLNWPEQ